MKYKVEVFGYVRWTAEVEAMTEHEAQNEMLHLLETKDPSVKREVLSIDKDEVTPL